MATKTPDAEAAAPPPKSKKMLMLVLVGVIVLALAGAGGWIFLSKKNAVEDEEAEEEAATQQVAESSGPPTYLPLENMVVNLADPGGDRVAQIGVTLELSGTAATDVVKAYLPTIRSEILMLISQRTADELLTREGKEKLATDIIAETSKHFPGGGVAPKKGGKNAKKNDSGKPIRGVLFSSFIVQ